MIKHGSTSLDTNALAVTEAFDVSTIASMDWVVEGLSGTHALHSVAVDGSNDTVIWREFSSINGEGSGAGIVVNWRYLRFRTSVVEGAESTVDIEFSGKG